MKIITTNRKARHEFFIEDSFEAGIELTGAEVKSLRQGKANISDGFCVFSNGELFLRNAQIVQYEKGSYFNSEEKRDRKLLMHRREIDRLKGKTGEKGLTLIPLKLYFKGSLIKAEIALCRGKKLFDKRDALKQKDVKRDIERHMKDSR